MYSRSNESVTGERASSGGVTNLLKMVRAQCAAAVVIAALHGESGEHIITMSGGPDDDSVGKPAQKLVRHLWDGALEGGDAVTVRQLRLPKGLAPGIGRQADVAVVPVGATGGDRPDLLCVIGPDGGIFTPARLDTIGSMAARLASYQQARAAVAGRGSSPQAPLPAAPTTTAVEAPAPQPPAAPEPSPAPAFHAHLSDQQRGTAEAAGTAWPADPLGTLFSPDPLTGLPSVPSLLGRLGENLGRLPVVGGSVGLVFVRVVPEVGTGAPSDAHINSVADALQQHVRPDDMVCRLDDRTFGVVSALSPRSCDVSVIEGRLVAGARAAVEHSVSGLVVLCAHASVDVDHPVGPEALLSRVLSELGDP